MPIPGQFFNTGPPIRPLLPGFGNPGFRLPPQLRPHIPINIPQPRPQVQNVPNKFRVTAPPKTTIFVGNISEEIDTELLQKICDVSFDLFFNFYHFNTILGMWNCQ